MSDVANKHHLKLKNYVIAASDLAESLQKDIKKGNKISTETVLNLSRFIAAANKFKDGIEVLNNIQDKRH